MKRSWTALALGLVMSIIVPAGPASADAVRDGQWYLSALNVPTAWQTTRGAGATVCVIDTGIDAQVADLRGAVKARKQFTHYVDSDGLVTSHGTGVASVLAGRGHGTNRTDGVSGIAPAATLLDAVVGESDKNATRQVADALRWCVKKGAGVINMSFGALVDGPVGAAVAYAESKDVVLVAASTNTFENLDTQALPNPAGLPGVLAVTGIDQDLQHDDGAFNSSVGKAVSIAAPFSTTSCASGYAQVGLPLANVRTAAAKGMPYVEHACGTSYSSAIVAGAAALIRAAHPRMSADDVIAALLATATPAGSGRPNRTYGWGILNVGAAVAATLPASSGNPVITGTVPALPSPAPTNTPPASTPAASSAASTGGSAATTANGSSSSSSTAWWVVLALAVIAVGSAVVLVSRRRSRSAS